MDFIKVLDQTVREIKREVNMKVLKVPEIEQKVLDATSNEPWGPHGSALAEIAQATKKFTECQMIMNVLWTRLTDTGKNWRHVYKALAVIEYLVAHGSERAVDDILEHTFQISSLSSFEYVELNGKDMGINVRKKSESIMSVLNNKEKMQEVRNKAAANHDKYVGLSSTGITYRSSSAAFGSSNFSEGYKDRNRYDDETEWNYGKRDGFGKDSYENERNGLSKGSKDHGKDKDDSYGPVSSENVTASSGQDDDDFDPRGSSTAGPAAVKSNQVDLFGESLIDFDEQTSAPTERTTPRSNASNEDLFADATFVSAAPHVEAKSVSHSQDNIDLFAHSTFPASSSSTTDFFTAPDQPMPTGSNTSKSEPTNPNVIDPFASMPLNNFESNDAFGDFTGPSSAEPVKTTTQNGVGLNKSTSTSANPQQKKDTFQVKSGIWADSLSRGLIDLNISAPKKVSLADIGIVGSLGDGTEEKDKILPSSAYMGTGMGIGMGMGTGVGRPAAYAPPSKTTGTPSSDFNFSNLGNQFNYGSFK